ncbi:MAG: 3-oxoacyl-ACP reductase, partial [Myxococcota bacterium]
PRGPRSERPLHDLPIAFASHGDSAVLKVLAAALPRAGADVSVAGDLSAFRAPGEAYGRPARPLDLEELPERYKAHGLVFDATAARTPEDLRAVYEFFHPLMRRIASSGRAVVIGTAPSALADDPVASATQAALEGFTRSLAKEIGKRGSTAQVIYVEPGAEARIEGPLRFFLSHRSAFVSGQPVWVSAQAKDGDPDPWEASLEGKVALVTGAARGIGEATAEILANEGAKVVCLDRPQDDQLCSQVARRIGGSVLLADVSDPEAPDKIAAILAEEHGGVDIVVHNAGITRDKTLAKMKPELWDLTLNINLAAIQRITGKLVDDGVLHDHGRLVLLSSVAGIAGNMGQTNYAASKSGVMGYVRALAPTVAERGITVNAIAPGFIETRLTAAIPVMIREAGRRLSNLGQGGLPRDVGEAITFLSTPGAVGVTGNVLRVCGGALIGA